MLAVECPSNDLPDDEHQEASSVLADAPTEPDVAPDAHAESAEAALAEKPFEGEKMLAVRLSRSWVSSGAVGTAMQADAKTAKMASLRTMLKGRSKKNEGFLKHK